jgi:hypothetical protein
MANLVNFYENLQEANIRLRKTIVLYDGHPYFVLHLADGFPDDRIRIYLDDLTVLSTKGNAYGRLRDFPPVLDMSQYEATQALEAWINRESNQGKGVIRKLMSSRKFDKFRPFPLGNVNTNGQVVYCERSPTRNTYQGLRSNSYEAFRVTPVPMQKFNKMGEIVPDSIGVGMDMYSPDFAAMILGIYPSAEEVVEKLKSPVVANSGVAFSREFSIFRGPIDMLFLCYQDKGVGLLDSGDLSSLIIGKEYGYLKETIEELNLFNEIKVKGN